MRIGADTSGSASHGNSVPGIYLGGNPRLTQCLTGNRLGIVHMCCCVVMLSDPHHGRQLNLTHRGSDILSEPGHCVDGDGNLLSLL